jgi:hypothetical protein
MQRLSVRVNGVEDLSPAHGRADSTANETRRIAVLNIVC